MSLRYFVRHPYPRDAVTLSIDSLNPVCTQLNSGAVTVAVQGDQAPYWQPEGLYVWEVNYVDLENIARTAHGTVLLIRWHRGTRPYRPVPKPQPQFGQVAVVLVRKKVTGKA